MKLNKPLIAKMIERLECSPETYDQGTPGQSYQSRLGEYLYSNLPYQPRPRPEPECGSVGCLMMQAIICDAPNPQVGIKRMYKILSTMNIVEHVVNLTGLPDEIFGATSNGWPEPYRSAWGKAKTYKGQTRAAINLLKAILKTDGKILDAEGR